MHARRNPNNLSVSSAAYAQLSPAITSATLLSPSIASRRGLLSPSPPPSPNLPSLIPRHGKKSPSLSHSRLVKRVLVGCCGVVVLVWLIVHQIYVARRSPLADYAADDGEEWEMVGDNDLPSEPSAIVLQDAKGASKWTVSIPSSHEFPLRPAQYAEICHQSHELSKQLRAEAFSSSTLAKRMLSYYAPDQFYIDVQDAEEQALLPPSKAQPRPQSFVDDVAVANKETTSNLKVCERSLTYVMETEDAGFGNTLLRMWMSYGLAKAENRTFFVDDTRWPYGRYSSYFTPPPSAGCLPPPRPHMVPCPHNARHIVVSGATVQNTFGHAFTDEWEDPRKMRVDRQHKIFGLLRTGYEALFKLRPDDARYVADRTKSLYGSATAAGAAGADRAGILSIGVHVRKGDKHPFEFQYQKDYIPLDRYLEAARELYIDRVENGGKSAVPSRKRRGGSGSGEKKDDDDETRLKARHTASKIVVASDDPLVYESKELGPNAIRAQDRIVLATKAALEAAQGKTNPWIDEITGWEGGFYRDIFFSLGQPVANNKNNGNNGNNANAGNNANNNGNGDTRTAPVPLETMRLRELVGRAYLIDLAVLGRADATVCTVSSIGCRILAVMMGWERAIVRGDWKNIDGLFDWRGITW